MENTSGLCYICSDKRRSAETDATQTRINNKPYEDTFKETLLKAIFSGVRDEDISENGESEREVLPNAAGSLSISSQGEYTSEYLYKKVENDSSIFICRRCEGLLRDFDYHEKQVFLIGETIRMFFTKRDNPKISDSTCDSSNNVVTVCKEKKRLDEKRGILAAFRAMRKSNPIIRSRGRKRKETNMSGEKSETSENEQMEDTDVGLDTNDLDLDNALGVRVSKRIQRRREEGLVIRWGDVHGETSALEAETGNQGPLEESFHPGDIKPRRRGRKPNIAKLMKSSEGDNVPGLQSASSLKYGCPFCYRFYIPSLSRIHGCISYKNQLRCNICNIFFTSYIRLEKHLEVIHLKQKDLKCAEPGCDFTCISQPALVLHEHFHRLNDASGAVRESPVSNVASGSSHVLAAELNAEQVEVTVINDDHGSVCSPDTVDEVSFQFDEKSLVSSDATVNVVKIKSTMKESGVETCKVVLKCNCCNLEFRSKKLHDDHLKEAYCGLQKDTPEYISSTEMQAEKNVNYDFISVDSRSVPEIFVKQGMKETLTSGPLKDEVSPTKCKFTCSSCSKQLTSLKSLDEHVKNYHAITPKIISSSEVNINYPENNGEEQLERPMKCSFLSMNSKETAEIEVKKNFNVSQAPLWMVEKMKDPNR
ncbi:uncharacterized protein [Palaemon carinicauda]|uniref:uncharacterized protein n=1 Tax=Palaemon carinicauda TaxID=392227 RepID=UPI0035B6874D